MINWTVDKAKFKKEQPKEFTLWRLTQLINYGLDGEKLDKKEVTQAETVNFYLNRLKKYKDKLNWGKFAIAFGFIILLSNFIKL